jgi:class 3 adenylate cyclase/tetratricopeptide (TPR) repeat protein
MHRLQTYLPQDRLRALADSRPLPDRTYGSAILADISGFTRLTEKLTQSLGARKGADTLSQQLNAVYSSLIDQVERYGGSIISFAGDSIIGWFEEAGGSPAASRAVTCASAMQSRIASFTDLSLKIAIATGPARRFLVGDPEIQYLDTLVGQTIMRLAAAERLAGKGEILLDQATCKATRAQAETGETRTDAATSEQFSVFEHLVQPSDQHPLSALNESTLTAVLLQPWLLPTVFQIEHNNLSAFLTELRPVVPLFLNFSGIDYDHDIGAEEKLNRFVTHVQKEVAKYEGALLQLVIGDKGSYMYVVFGAPIAHEDDAQRAVYAALELRQLPEELAYIRSLQIGISLGTLRVGAYGSNTRRTYAVLGDEVNVAARLMAKATEGEILVTGRVQIEGRQAFTFEPREPIHMKGLAEPQPVFSVTGISHHRATRLPEPEYRLPMVGRQEELGLVAEKLKLTLQGKGQVIAIVAEAGMGKSRLVAEIIRLARKRGFTGYGGACQSSGTNTPYLVWRTIWQAFFDLDLEMQPRKLVRWLEGELEELAPERLEALPLLELVLGVPLPDNDFTRGLGPQDRKSVLESLLEACLKMAALEAPLLIVLEDLHWIDPLSHDLLETLARVSENLPVCFVLAYRRPDLERLRTPRVETLTYFTKIELAYLTAADAEQLVRAKLAQLFPERTGGLPKTLAQELMARSQGNPFFIEELLNYLHDRGLDPYNPDSFKSLELPASLQTLILSRIDQLTEPQKVTLRVASVIGRIIPFSWLHGYYPALGEEETVKGHLTELSKVDLTPLDTPEPELAYIFKHIVTQEVAYESLSYNTRAQLHELLAKYLEAIHTGDPPLDLLAFHYSRTENAAKKRGYLKKAGEAAQNAYANQTALEYYRQALQASPNQEEWIDLRLRSGAILQMIGEWDAAKAEFEAALQIAEEGQLSRQIIPCRIKLATWHSLRGYFPEARDQLEKTSQFARQFEDHAGQCDIFIELANVQWRLGNFETAFQSALQGLELARQMGDKKRETESLFFMGTISGQQAKYAESRAYFEETLALVSELKDKRRIAAILTNNSTNYYQEGNYGAARELIVEALRTYQEIGDKRGRTIALNNLGNIFYIEGDYQTASEHYRETLKLAHETSDRYTMALALSALGITAFQQEKYAEANEYFQECLGIYSQLGDKVGLSLLYCYLGLLALAHEQTGAARNSFEQGLDIAWQSDIKLYLVYNLIGIACVLLAGQRFTEAVKLLGAAEAYTQKFGFKLETELQRPYERALVTAKECLDAATFQTAWEDGQAMNIEQAVHFAQTADPSTGLT